VRLVIVGILMILVGFGDEAFAQSQTITPSPLTGGAAPGAAVSFDVDYGATNGDMTTTGIGIHVCFNSSQLTFQSLTNERTAHRFAPATMPSLDGANVDGDSLTDRCFEAAYAELGGNFPGENLPVRLFTLNFTATAGFTGTTVRFVETSSDPAFEFVATPATR